MGGLFLSPFSLLSVASFSLAFHSFIACSHIIPSATSFLHTSSFTCMFIRFCRHAIGAILSEPLVDPTAPKIEGSVMLASAETREEVVEQLRRDTYFTSGVWDWENVVIYPVSGFVVCSEVGEWKGEGKGDV